MSGAGALGWFNLFTSGPTASFQATNIAIGSRRPLPSMVVLNEILRGFAALGCPASQLIEQKNCSNSHVQHSGSKSGSVSHGNGL